MGTRRFAVLLMAALAVAMVAASGAAAKTCHPGTHPYGNGEARTFCGKASAHVSLPGQTETIKGGSCQKTTKYFTINIGTIVLTGNAPNRPNYFGITVGRTPLGGGGSPAGHDGTYTGGAVAFVIKHKRYAVRDAVVTLAGNRTKGSFSGTLFSGGQASGTFSCS
jgi:hypothetical protein